MPQRVEQGTAFGEPTWHDTEGFPPDVISRRVQCLFMFAGEEQRGHGRVSFANDLGSTNECFSAPRQCSLGSCVLCSDAFHRKPLHRVQVYENASFGGCSGKGTAIVSGRDISELMTALAFGCKADEGEGTESAKTKEAQPASHARKVRSANAFGKKWQLTSRR